MEKQYVGIDFHRRRSVIVRIRDAVIARVSRAFEQGQVPSSFTAYRRAAGRPSVLLRMVQGATR